MIRNVTHDRIDNRVKDSRNGAQYADLRGVHPQAQVQRYHEATGRRSQHVVGQATQAVDEFLKDGQPIAGDRLVVWLLHEWLPSGTGRASGRFLGAATGGTAPGRCSQRLALADLASDEDVLGRSKALVKDVLQAFGAGEPNLPVGDGHRG